VSMAWGRGQQRHNSVNGLTKRMAVMRSEARVEAMERSEARVKVAACFEDEDEAAAWFRPGIEDGMRRWHDGVWGDR
jgi:hypothetical protein